MRKYRYKILIGLLLLVVILPVGITFSRYVYDFISYYILESNDFFFNSDKLGEHNIVYGVENWGGVGTFEIEFELNNHKNNLLTSVSDINYELNVTHSEDVQTSINLVNGTILTNEKTDSYTVVVTPSRVFNTGETVRINIVAKSTSPYVKTLSATFNITVGRKGISYEIIDKANQPYFDLLITNAARTCTVKQAFTVTSGGNTKTYNVNDTIGSIAYDDLSDENKGKVQCALVTLAFNPNDLRLDMTNTNYLHKIEQHTRNLSDGYTYVDRLKFQVGAESSTIVRFYKMDVTRDYTYPITNNTSVVTFTAE